MELITLEPTSVSYSVSISNDKTLAKLDSPSSFQNTTLFMPNRQVNLVWELFYDEHEYIRTVFRKNDIRGNPPWKLNIVLDGELLPTEHTIKFVKNSIQFQGRVGARFVHTAQAWVWPNQLASGGSYPGSPFGSPFGSGNIGYYSIDGWNRTLAEGLSFQPYQSNGSFSNCIAIKTSSVASCNLPGDFAISIDFNMISSPASVAATPGHLFFTRAVINATDYIGGYEQAGLWYIGAKNDKVFFNIIAGPDTFYHTIISNDNIIHGDNTLLVTRTAGILKIRLNGVWQINIQDPPTLSLEDLSGSEAVTINGPYQTYSPLPNTWNPDVATYSNIHIYDLS